MMQKKIAQLLTKLEEITESPEPAVLKEGNKSKFKFLSEDDFEALNECEFKRYFKERGIDVFYPVALLYFGFKDKFPKSPYPEDKLLESIKDMVEVSGIAKHRRGWGDRIESPPSEDTLLNLFPKAIFDEIKLRNIFKYIEELLQKKV